MWRTKMVLPTSLCTDPLDQHLNVQYQWDLMLYCTRRWQIDLDNEGQYGAYYVLFYNTLLLRYSVTGSLLPDVVSTLCLIIALALHRIATFCPSPV